MSINHQNATLLSGALLTAALESPKMSEKSEDPEMVVASDEDELLASQTSGLYSFSKKL